MADANSTARPQQTGDNRRTGALAATLALCTMERIAEYPRPENETSEEYLSRRKDAVAAVVNAAGTLSPFLDGFVETLAQYAHDSLIVGTPDLYVWKSDAAMTIQELAVNRAHFAEGDQS